MVDVVGPTAKACVTAASTVVEMLASVPVAASVELGRALTQANGRVRTTANRPVVCRVLVRRWKLLLCAVPWSSASYTPMMKTWSTSTWPLNLMKVLSLATASSQSVLCVRPSSHMFSLLLRSLLLPEVFSAMGLHLLMYCCARVLATNGL